MKAVRIADLKNNLSRHLTRVRAGGDVVVYDRDTPVARIVPFDQPAVSGARKGGPDQYWTAERLNALERLGAIARQANTGLADWIQQTHAIGTPKRTRSAVDVLLRSRRESKR